jgi:5-methylcytosine-specific restriction protein A
VARVRGRRLQDLRYRLFRGQPFCAHCHVAVATIRDHVVPLAEGGSEIESNVQALCHECHDRKTQDEARRGMVRR